jgi:hypothetical protein
MSGVQRTALLATLAVTSTVALLLACAATAGATALPPGTRLHVTITLRPRDPAALGGYAQAVSTPGSPAYLHYLTPRQFARRFAPRPAQIARVRRSLQAHGLRPGPTAAGGLSIPVLATAGQVERGLSVSLSARSLHGRRLAIAASARPRLGNGADRVVQSVLGLNTTGAPRPLLARSPAAALLRGARSGLRSAAARAPHVATGGPQACSDARTAAANQSAYTADQIASAYDFSGLYGAGNTGAGVTVAVYELEPNLAGDIAAYQACYGTHAPVSYIPVDGGVGSGSGSGEAALDIENLIGLAPGVNVLVYQGPNSQSSGPGSGPYDTLAAIVNQNRARVVSISWGECEPVLGQGGAAAEASLFQQAAVQGQTVIAASGDAGSEDCNDGTVSGDTELAVDDPASQPFVTGIGGTTLQFPGPRPTESVWNAGGSITGGLVQAGAGGGGISSLWTMPRDQLDASPLLGVLSAGRTGTTCLDLGGYCREVPDVSANADPSAGYVVYWSGDSIGEPSGWQSIGGTSAAVPVWAALMALSDASRACAAGPVGFAGPALYRAAGSSYGGNFNDVRTGNNDFTGTNGGSFGAHSGYDEASGLGSPNGAPLAAAVCAATLRLVNPGTLHMTARASVARRLRANDPRGVAISFGASGLPPGLKLSQTTGQLTGTPRRSGTFAVNERAQDEQGSTAATTFSISVGRAPGLSRLSTAGLRTRHPRIGFTLTAGRGAPSFSRLSLSVPAGLRVASGRGLSLKARGVRRPGFRARVSRGVLEISLRRSLSQLSLRLTSPGLKSSSGRRPHARRRGTPRLGLSVLDTGAGTSSLHARLRGLS